MNTVIKITFLIVAVIISVSLFLYLLEKSLDNPPETKESIDQNNSGGIFSIINTLPDLDEQERIESLTGLHLIMYIFYLLLIVINISFIWIIKQDESSSKIILYGLYTSISLVLFINILLLQNHSTWSLNHAIRLTLDGVGAGFLASLISICIYSIKNVFKILKEESKSLLGLLSARILSPNINTSIAISKAWIIFTLLMSLFFVGLFLI